MGKSFDSSWVAPSFGRALSVRLVIEGTIIVTIPLITPFLLNMLMLRTSVVNLVVCIFIVDDVTQISDILISSSATLPQWSDTAGQVPTWTLSMVKLVTPYFTVTVEDRVNHSCCV
jgi:hypothetical protein